MISSKRIMLIKLLRKSNIKTIHTQVQSKLINDYKEKEHVLRGISLVQRHCACSFDTALDFYKYNSDVLSSLSITSLDSTLSYLVNNLKINVNDFRFESRLGSIKSLEQRKLILQDFGFPISARTVAEFEELVRKTPQELASRGILPDDPVKNILSLLEDAVAQRIGEHLSVDVYMQWPLFVIHQGVLALLLAEQLECTQKEALELLHNQPDLMNRSVSELHKVITIFIRDYGCQKNDLLADPKLLMWPIESLSSVSNEAGFLQSQLKKNIKSGSEFLHIQPKKINDLNKIFQEHMITEEQSNFLSTRNLSQKGNVKYVKSAEEDEERNALECQPNYLRIADNCDYVKQSLEEMETTGHDTWSAEKTAKNTKKENNSRSSRCNKVQVIKHLANTLGHPANEIKKRIKYHPKSAEVSFNGVLMLVGRLMMRGITKEQIYYSLPVVLYDADVVMKTLSELETNSELQPFDEWRTHPGLLNLVVYYIERRTYFNFDGIFLTSKLYDECRNVISLA